MNNENIMVSISCLAYNHEKYIRKTLDGFVNQKTNFKFEVLIHDDGSTDKTAEIIKEYEAKYPDIIKPIYQAENQYQKGIKISRTFQYPRIKGKYVAFCEGDDYWTDENKLQKQFDLMEKNKDCSVCVHRVGSIDEDGTRINIQYPGHPIPEYLSKKDFVKEIINSYQFHTSSYFLKSHILKNLGDTPPDFITTLRVGDVGIMLLCAAEGNLCYIDEEMSVYRKNVPGSWSLRGKSQETRLKRAENFIKGIKLYDEYTDFKYSDDIKYAIAKCEFSKLGIQGKYREMFAKENRKFLSGHSLKTKLIYGALALFPFLKKYIIK